MTHSYARRAAAAAAVLFLIIVALMPTPERSGAYSYEDGGGMVSVWPDGLTVYCTDQPDGRWCHGYFNDGRQLEEDDYRWACDTMGNRVCGPNVRP